MKWSEAKEMTETLKNAVTLLFYIIVLAFFLIVIWPQIKNNLEVKEISIAGVTMGPKVKEALNTLENVSTKPSVQAKDTGKVPDKVIAAAKLLDTTINYGNNTWVYLGQIINGKLTNSHFRINEIPKAGDVITAIDAVYKRKDPPVPTNTGEWKLGNVRGAVADNESVTVLAVREIQDQNYWALVQ